MKKVVVVAYDPQWPRYFSELRDDLATIVGDIAVAIEHVGSTSVPGLAAKPIIDIDIVVDTADVGAAIQRLAGAGYQHRGNLGVEGREAFRQPPHLIQHHLYVCPVGSSGLRNHLVVRDYLRKHQVVMQEYDAAKRRLASTHAADIDSYVDGKTELILRILQDSKAFSKQELASIESANRL